MGLTLYQRATVNHLKEVFTNGMRAYIVADEVGLGKTYVALGLIEEMQYRRIIYIASNAEIAKQNKESLKKKMGSETEEVSGERLSMMMNAEYEESKRYIMSLSPATTFTGKGSQEGTAEERAFYYENLTEAAKKTYEKYYKAEGGKCYTKSEQEKEKKALKFFMKCREVANQKALQSFQPDLIIMDEFHRFHELLDPVGGKVQFNLWEYVKEAEKKPHLLLLSATPYQYNTDVEIITYEQKGNDEKEETDEMLQDEMPDSKAFSSFKELREYMEQINGITKEQYPEKSESQYIYDHILCRTERNWLGEAASMEQKFCSSVDAKVFRNYIDWKIKWQKERLAFLEKIDAEQGMEIAQKVFSHECTNDHKNIILKNLGLLGNGKIIEKDGRNRMRQALGNIEHCLQGYNHVRTYLDDAPEYTQFAFKYSSVIEKNESKGKDLEQKLVFSELLKKQGNYCIRKNSATGEPNKEYFEKIQGHYKWDKLKEIVFPTNAEFLLWVLPLLSEDKCNMFSSLREYSKTLVFARYKMSTRAIAALTSMEAQIRLLDHIGDRPLIELNGEMPDEIFEPFKNLILPAIQSFHRGINTKNFSEKEMNENSKLRDWALRREKPDKKKKLEDNCRNDSIEVKEWLEGVTCNINDALKEFFLTTHAKRVLTAWAVKMGITDYNGWDIVKSYCEEADWNGMWQEYFGCMTDFDEKTEVSLRILKDICSVLNWKDGERTRILIMPDWSEETYPCTFGERYIQDYSDKGAHDKEKMSRLSKNNTTDRLEYLRNRFQSPFYPFVMAASEMAREGVDLHNYAGTIIHWSVPSRLSVYVQEEGRIDRRASYSLRRKMVKIYRNSSPKNQEGISISKLYADAEAIYRSYGMILDERVCKGGLFPHWYLPDVEQVHDEGIDRYYFYMPLSKEETAYKKLEVGLRSYSTFGIEGIETKELCPFIRMQDAKL